MRLVLHKPVVTSSPHVYKLINICMWIHQIILHLVVCTNHDDSASGSLVWTSDTHMSQSAYCSDHVWWGDMRCFECVKPIRHTSSAAAHLRWLQLTVRLLVATEEKFAATLFDAVVPKVIPDSAEQSCPMPAGFQSPDPAFNGYAQGRNAAVRGRAATGTRCCQFIENDGWTIMSNETDGLMDPDFWSLLSTVCIGRRPCNAIKWFLVCLGIHDRIHWVFVIPDCPYLYMYVYFYIHIYIYAIMYVHAMEFCVETSMSSYDYTAPVAASAPSQDKSQTEALSEALSSWLS